MKNVRFDSFRHFLMGVAAVVVPAIPGLLASSAVQNFVSNHPLWAVYFPLIAGLVVELYHRYVPAVTKA